MSSFTDPLVVIKVGERLWKTYREFSYYLKEPDGEKITVPAGFLTDFASVPRPLWVILPPDGLYTQSAVLHDFLYATQILTRKESDDIFLDGMKILGVPFLVRQTIYRAVRMFGWIPWRNHEQTISVDPID